MRSTLIGLLRLTALAGAVAIGWLIYFARHPLDLPAAPFQFELKSGSSLRTVARGLNEVHLLPEPWSFVAMARILGASGQMKPGIYELTEPVTPLQLLLKITRGDALQSEIKLVEGYTFGQVRKLLDANPDVAHDSKQLTEAEILQRIGATESAAEGLLFPDTYVFGKGTSDLELIKRSYKAMKSHMATAWEKRDPAVPYTNVYEALIMASIIEKETAVNEERPIICAVFLNRLKQNMKLQTDPTVIYGLGESYAGNLHKHDLTADTPYNTYTRAGLPPTPIAIPSLASIQAALIPAQTSALFFVARGDGSHQFSDSLSEHNRAVARYLK